MPAAVSRVVVVGASEHAKYTIDVLERQGGAEIIPVWCGASKASSPRSVLHGMTIGEHSVVGAGSVVLHDLPDHVVAFGTPAQVVRTRAEGDRYL